MPLNIMTIRIMTFSIEHIFSIATLITVTLSIKTKIPHWQ